MRSTSVSPSAHRPAITSLAEARRSVAITGAPTSASTPLHDRRVAFDGDIGAQPMQLLHVHEPVLEDRLGDAADAVGDAVERHELRLHVGGKPGYGAVRRLTARGALLHADAHQSAPASICAPASRSLSSTASSVRGAAPRSSTSPPQAAAAHEKGAGLDPVGHDAVARAVQRLDALDRMRSVPAPSIRAPIALRQLARSTTSGSRAAFSITVSPSASAAAIIRFSVPVTVTMSVTMRAPRRRLRAASATR